VHFNVSHEYMKKPINIVCMEGTVYENDVERSDCKDTIIEYLHLNEKTTDIASITYYKKNYVEIDYPTIGHACRSKYPHEKEQLDKVSPVDVYI